MAREKITKADIYERQREFYKLLCGVKPPMKMIEAEAAREDSGLQDWVNDNLLHKWQFATGISVIEAAEAISISQIGNGGEELDDD